MEAFAWDLSLGNFRLGTSAWELSLGNFRLETFVAGLAGLAGWATWAGWGIGLEDDGGIGQGANPAPPLKETE